MGDNIVLRADINGKYGMAKSFGIYAILLTAIVSFEGIHNEFIVFLKYYC
jgi:hypothetical protein